MFGGKWFPVWREFGRADRPCALAPSLWASLCYLIHSDLNLRDAEFAEPGGVLCVLVVDVVFLKENAYMSNKIPALRATVSLSAFVERRIAESFGSLLEYLLKPSCGNWRVRYPPPTLEYRVMSNHDHSVHSAPSFEVYGAIL